MKTLTAAFQRDDEGDRPRRAGGGTPGSHLWAHARQSAKHIIDATALWFEVAPEELNLVEDIRLPEPVRATLELARREREHAQAAQEAAAGATREAARALVKDGRLSVRDAADALGWSHQRVPAAPHQLSVLERKAPRGQCLAQSCANAVRIVSAPCRRRSRSSASAKTSPTLIRRCLCIISNYCNSIMRRRGMRGGYSGVVRVPARSASICLWVSGEKSKEQQHDDSDDHPPKDLPVAVLAIQSPEDRPETRHFPRRRRCTGKPRSHRPASTPPGARRRRTGLS